MRAIVGLKQEKDGRVDLTDGEHAVLMGRVRNSHDREAFRALFVHFGPRIKALMMKSGADPALAEDIMQDVMMSVWRKAELFAPDRGTVSAWVFTIARNARIDRLRQGSSRPYEDVETLDLPSGEADAEAETLLNERAGRVTEALTELPAEQRQIIELAYIEDMAQSSIAEKLSLPLGTVKSRMRLAYAKLKQKLEAVK